MTSPPLHSALADLGERAARRAGEALMARFRRPAQGVGTKSSPTDMVSDADREADRLIVETIRGDRPHDTFLTEESGAVGGDGAAGDGVRWVVDPLDGTVNFLYGIGNWAVSIAAEQGGEVVAGIVYNPVTDEMFRAVRGHGATVNGVTLRTTQETRLDRALLATGFYYETSVREAQGRVVAALLPMCRDVRRPGAASLDLASVAAGRVDGYFEAPLGGAWDWAAGALLVTEAGGAIRPFVAPWGSVPGVFAAGMGLIDVLESSVRGLVPSR